MKLKTIQVFEHSRLRIGEVVGEVEFKEKHFLALSKYLEKSPLPYYQLMYKSVKFCEHVGVLQVGDLTIEILPKADQNLADEANKAKWRNVLLDMLKECRMLKVKHLSHAHLKLRSHSILDLYIEMFLDEADYLLHQGLVKRYRTCEANQKAWKGSLQFAEQVSKNTIHRERFFVRYQTYDRENIYNQLVCKTIRFLPTLTKHPSLTNRIAALSLNFPELPDLKVSKETFDRLVYDRKTEHYRTALEIARLLLLNYHPDIQSGREHVLALLFDMNMLWEKYIYVQLKKVEDEGFKVRQQVSKLFWQHKHIRPDILLTIGDEQIVLDTKWKALRYAIPSDEDLKQMYVYNHHFEAGRSILLYPQVFGAEGLAGEYALEMKGDKHHCQLAFVEIVAQQNESQQWRLLPDFGKMLKARLVEESISV